MRVLLLMGLLLALAPCARGQVLATHAEPPPPEHDGAALCSRIGHAAHRAYGPAKVSRASDAFDATYYHLWLDVLIDERLIVGRTRVQGRARGAALATLALDFASGMTVSAVRDADGTPLTFSHAADVLTIAFPEPVPDGGALALDVEYHGRPAQAGFGTFEIGRRPGGDPYVWSLSEPYGAREWWPSKDHPSDKADSVRVTVTVPAPMRVGSNGLLVGTSAAGGRVTYDWVHRYPITTYLVSVAGGVYDVYEQTYARPPALEARYGPLALPVLHYAYRGTTAFEGTSAMSGWRRVLDVLPVLEDWFGPYPFPSEKYGHAHFTWPGGMEHQTMSSMGGASLGLVVHELAHMWFGNLVSPRAWPHLWLNEGLATYGELLYWEAAREALPGLFESALAAQTRRARQAQGTLVVQDTASVANLFAGARVYSKGALVVHMLRRELGDEAFRAALHAYTNDPATRYGTAVTDDLRRAAEAVSGRDLGRFFAQWVTEGTGYPVLAARYGAMPDAAGGYRLTLVVEQQQTPPLSNVSAFALRLPVEVATDAGPVRVVVNVDAREQTFTLPLPARPLGITLDPDGDLLRNEIIDVTRLEGDPGVPAAPALGAVAPNPAGPRAAVNVALPVGGPVRLTLLDAQGRLVRVLFEGQLPPGQTPVALTTEGLGSGVYFVRLEAGDARALRSLVVAR
ncbi:MAG: M1 family aminopeptidase [Rubricoccaceae bacterium]